MRVLILICLVVGGAPSCDGGTQSDNLSARQRAWQDSLDQQQRFQFNARQTGMIYSLSQFRGDCHIAMVFDPAKPWQLTFQIQNAGKNLATVVGHTDSVFVGKKGTLYFAQFSRSDCGCRVIVFDTSTGNRLWEKQLQAAGLIPHSAYANEVTMRLAPDSPAGGATTNPSEWHSLVITGAEGAGNYVEVLDTKSGAELAHRVYR